MFAYGEGAGLLYVFPLSSFESNSSPMPFESLNLLLHSSLLLEKSDTIADYFGIALILLT